MKKENAILSKSYKFSLSIINCYKNLCDIHKEYTLSRQLLRSGTSIGANIEEAQGANSSNDFAYKLRIAYKEARETNYRVTTSLGQTKHLRKAIRTMPASALAAATFGNVIHFSEHNPFSFPVKIFAFL